MRKLIILVFALACITVQAQDENFKEKLVKEANTLDSIVRQEKADLKMKILAIEEQLDAGEITENQAKNKKEAAAKNTANNITAYTESHTENIIVIVDDIVNDTSNKPSLSITEKIEEAKGVKEKHEAPKRTVSRFVFTYGLNTMVQHGTSLVPSTLDYKLWQSNSVEVGLAYKTRLIKQSSLLNVKYGVSFLWNSYAPKGNKYHVVEDGATLLQEHTSDLDKSKLKNVYVMVPLYLEFDFSKSKVLKDRVKLQRNKSVRIGLGGYAGLKLNTKQVLKYQNDIGKIEETIAADYNVSPYKYGLSSYIGYKDMSLFANYDLTPVFENGLEQNLTMGVRFDW